MKFIAGSDILIFHSKVTELIVSRLIHFGIVKSKLAKKLVGVCVCMCVCERETERQRDRERERETERERERKKKRERERGREREREREKVGEGGRERREKILHFFPKFFPCF